MVTWKRGSGLWRTSGKFFKSIFTVHDNGEETAGPSQRSTLDLAQADVRAFTKNRCDFMARGWLERIGKVSKIQFWWYKYKRS